MATREQLATQVIELARAALLADNHFLAPAIGRLQVAFGEMEAPFATDGTVLACDALRLLREFQGQGTPRHDLLHSVVHCLFLHPFVGASVVQAHWNLACDMAAERVVMEVLGPRCGPRGAQIALVLDGVQRDLHRRADAERIYWRLREGQWAGQVQEWAELFFCDDHGMWYKPAGSGGPGQGSGFGQGSEGSGGVGRAQGDAQSIEHEGTPSPASGWQDEPQLFPSGSREEPPAVSGSAGSGRPPSTEDAAPASPALGQAKAAAGRQRQEWCQVAQGLAVNLRTMSLQRGRQVALFVEDLERLAQRRVSYADFLRRFAVPGEVMRTSDEEFDSIFYTYGLNLYGDMPLVEPLEYCEERRVREFVIVIDTSASVQGEAVRRFVHTTYAVLKDTESFFDRVNVRILQCDMQVLSDEHIHSLDDLARWERGMKVLGGGGTDFRPAFAYVDNLVAEGEFTDLGGLVYFTDGHGAYPNWVPGYRCAFVFYDEDHCADDVPPWAAQIVLDDFDLHQDAG